jgi:PTH1 family peptidyl-tRNA hydrolase
MNLSGESVSALVNFYKIPLSDILVLSDDIDMEFGKSRLRIKGSSGGQNGLKSITSHLGTDEFSRLKI